MNEPKGPESRYANLRKPDQELVDRYVKKRARRDSLTPAQTEEMRKRWSGEKELQTLRANQVAADRELVDEHVEKVTKGDSLVAARREDFRKLWSDEEHLKILRGAKDAQEERGERARQKARRKRPEPGSLESGGSPGRA